jgi:hypothetical protein
MWQQNFSSLKAERKTAAYKANVWRAQLQVSFDLPFDTISRSLYHTPCGKPGKEAPCGKLARRIT